MCKYIRILFILHLPEQFEEQGLSFNSIVALSAAAETNLEGARDEKQVPAWKVHLRMLRVYLSRRYI